MTGFLGMSDIIDCGDNFSPWGHNMKLPVFKYTQLEVNYDIRWFRSDYKGFYLIDCILDPIMGSKRGISGPNHLIN